MITGDFSINLSYASSVPERPWANFGDSLNPILMHLLTGLKIKHSDFDEDAPRICAIGTILQDFSKGDLNVWGTGLDVTKTHSAPELSYFDPRFTGVNYKIHAVRGAVTEAVLKSFGLHTTGVYGDPAILLKKMLKSYIGDEKNGRVGIVCHLSELERYDDSAKASKDILRYDFDSDDVDLISTIVKPNPSSILEKIKEIAGYSYILSSSLHGLIIAEIFGTPCAYLGLAALPHGRYSIFDYREIVDHRFRDYYSGLRQTTLPVFFAPRDKKIEVSEVRPFLDASWAPPLFIDEIAEELVYSLPLKASGYCDHLDFPEYLNDLKL